VVHGACCEYRNTHSSSTGWQTARAVGLDVRTHPPIVCTSFTLTRRSGLSHRPPDCEYEMPIVIHHYSPLVPAEVSGHTRYHARPRYGRGRLGSCSFLGPNEPAPPRKQAAPWTSDSVARREQAHAAAPDICAALSYVPANHDVEQEPTLMIELGSPPRAPKMRQRHVRCRLHLLDGAISARLIAPSSEAGLGAEIAIPAAVNRYDDRRARTQPSAIAVNFDLHVDTFPKHGITAMSLVLLQRPLSPICLVEPTIYSTRTLATA